MSTIVSRSKNLLRAMLIGLSWGLGHTLTLLVIGIAILWLRISVPSEIGIVSEILVGLMLVMLGISSLKSKHKVKIHEHEHKHEDEFHTHFHAHDFFEKHAHEHRSFAVGMVHGLSGSAALMLIVLAAMKNMFGGIVYIAVFGFGSIAGMIAVTVLIGFPLTLRNKRLKKLNKKIRVLVGLLSILLGISILSVLIK